MLRKLYRFFIIPYTVFLLYLMFFGFGREPMEHHVVRLNPIFSTISFVEKNLLWNNWQNLAVNLIGNIVMFMPFGFLGWIFPKFNDFKRLLISFLSVLIVVEALQYFTRLGVFDIDDVLLNSVGVGLGFLLKGKFEEISGSHKKH